MASAADAAEHAEDVAALTTLTTAQLVAWWSAADVEAPSLALGLADFLGDVLGEYGQAATALAADWYDELRGAAGVRGVFEAPEVELPAPGRVSALAQWATVPVRTPDALLPPARRADAEPMPDLALERLSDGMQRVVAGLDRQTIAEAVDLDPASAVWARVAQPGCCAFCALMATRGAAYGSATSATTVVGRGRAGRPRGTRELGDKYHDACRCVAVPSWDEAPFEPGEDAARFEEAYFVATDKGARTVKQILASMRQTLQVA